ncbi:hypothetical protein MPER_09397, partial [Moniliophthora perniciosa FA553]
MQSYGNAFDGVSFHCYEGSVANQDTFHQAFPSKSIYFTECAGTIGSDWWSDMKWYIDNLWIGSLEHNSKSGLMWNIALDGNAKATIPKDAGGPSAKRIGVNLSGSLGWAVRVGAFVTDRSSSSESLSFRGVQ